MKNFENSDYALNKYSEGIVYRFADKIITVTLTDYLSENPGKTEHDFLALKEISDAIYLGQVRGENAQTNQNLPFENLEKVIFYSEQSPEDYFIKKIETQEQIQKRQEQLTSAKNFLSKLTEIQRRRYLLYYIDGLSTWKIAKLEGVNQSKIMKSLVLARKKIKKFLENIKK